MAGVEYGNCAGVCTSQVPVLRRNLPILFNGCLVDVHDSLTSAFDSSFCDCSSWLISFLYF